MSSSRALEEAAAQENNIISNAFFYLVAGSKVPKPKTSTSRRRAGRRRRGEREAEKLRYMPRSPVWPDGNCAWRRGRGRYYQSVSKMRPEQGARHMVQGPSHTQGRATRRLRHRTTQSCLSPPRKKKPKRAESAKDLLSRSRRSPSSMALDVSGELVKCIRFLAGPLSVLEGRLHRCCRPLHHRCVVVCFAVDIIK